MPDRPPDATSTPSVALPAPIVATRDDLPAAVRAALDDPSPGHDGTTEAAGMRWAWTAWGPEDEARPPILLVHGVTSSKRTYWRVGPALAATGRRVVAVDLPGHGWTGPWTGRHRFHATAADLAAFVETAGLGSTLPDGGRALAVVGHSWGAMVVATLPAAGLRPTRLVLLDAPAMTVEDAHGMTVDPVERHYDHLEEALTVVAATYPDWTPGDIEAKAEGLHRFDPAAVHDVLLGNGDWDGALASLERPEARAVETWVVRGEPAAGGLLSDAAAHRLVPLVGAQHVVTVAGGSHSPQRTHVEATVLALLDAVALDRDVIGSGDGGGAVEG